MFLKELNNHNILRWNSLKRISWHHIREDDIHYIVAEDRSVYQKQELMKVFLERRTKSAFLSEITKENGVEEIDADSRIIDVAAYLKTAKHILVVDRDRNPVFVLDNPWLVSEVEIAGSQRDLFCKIIHDIEEEIFLTDPQGVVLYMNPRSEETCGLSKDQCVGRNMRDLVRNGLFEESQALEAIEKNSVVEKIAQMRNGRYIISTATPLYDENQQLQYVLCTSKDIAELNELMKKHALITSELEESKRQVEILRDQMIAEKNYIFESRPMKEVKRTVMKVAPTDVTVLIDGETGTGKEITANMIHDMSRRGAHPMMKVNCGLIPKDLLESELFGYMPGAFSGASKEGKIGMIEAANKGTVFLDEIGEMPFLLQVKLLEFLQDRMIQRVGGIKKIPIDVRVIAATNRDLLEEVNKGNFRKDLYYRLSAMPIHLEPLRNRRDDIEPLVKMFLKKFNRQYYCHKRIDREVLSGLLRYDWPGNVRELMHVIERFVVSAEGDVIGGEFLWDVLGKPILSGRVSCSDVVPLKEAREELDHLLVQTAMKRYGSTRRAAEALGVNQSTVVRIQNRDLDK